MKNAQHPILVWLTGCLALLLFAQCQPKPKTEGVEEEARKEMKYDYSGEPLKVAVIGLVHTHVHWVLGREDYGDVEIIGIVESNQELAKQYSKQHGYSMDLVYPTMQELWEEKKPEAVLDFGRIIDHVKTVEFFAPKGVDIMVEKPLAVNWEHAQTMAKLAREHQVELLTNYETSWYGSTYQAREYVQDKSRLGPIQRLVFNTGHPGPIEIGCNPEFLEWLTDPVLNGGGALTDFGCYGANIATWLLEGEQPQSVSCVTRQMKPELYPKVEDEAIILVEYQNARVQINASWNWSHNRKDMVVYGKNNYLNCINGEDMVYLPSEDAGPEKRKAQPLPSGFQDPFAYFTQVVKNKYQPEEYALASLENNLQVMQILEAAKHSAQSGKSVDLKDLFP